MVQLTVLEIVEGGVDPALVSASGGGDTYLNDRNTFFFVESTDAGAINVTFTSQKSEVKFQNYGTLPLPSRIVSIPAGSRRMVQLPGGSFNNGSGQVEVTYENETNLTVGAFRPVVQ